MSHTRDIWSEQHEAAISRFVTGEDDREALVRNLEKLGFDGFEIAYAISLAEDEIAEQVHASGRRYYDQFSEGEQ